MDASQGSSNFQLYGGIIRRRAAWILLCVVIGGIGAYAYSKQKAKEYTATAAVSLNDNPLGQQVAGLAVSSSSNLLSQQASNREIVSLGPTAARTAVLLGHGLNAEKVASSLSIKSHGETNIVTVAATSTSPALAAAIANTYTNLFVKEQRSSNHRFFKLALALVRRQLAALSPAQRAASGGLDLEDRAHTLELLAQLNSYNTWEIAQTALVPSSPSGPKTKRNAILGLLLGLLVGLGLALLLERLDPRIREPGELEDIYDAPLLGAVPRSATLGRRAGSKAALSATEIEAFGLIRAHLRLLTRDRDMRTLVVASPASGDGKSTIARRLAEAYARSGSRTLLLEADLRRPTLAQQLDIKQGPGLCEVLSGSAQLDESLQSVAVVEAYGNHTLQILVGGDEAPTSPGELLEGQKMSAVLDYARSAFDLVVIDIPPLAAVPDAFALLTKVDGVILVGWVGRSRRDAAEGLRQVLEGSNAPLIGVVANGSKTGAPDPYLRERRKTMPAASVEDVSAAQELTSAGRQ
jgi:polysaccharide biosynthesis transport protein